MKVKRVNSQDSSVEIIDGDTHGWSTWIEFQRKILSSNQVISITDDTLTTKKYTFYKYKL